jgi:hypothetical protein
MPRSTSIAIAAGIGLVCAVIAGLFAIKHQDIWLVVMVVFIGMQAFQGLRIARMLRGQEAAARDAQREPWTDYLTRGKDDDRRI